MKKNLVLRICLSLLCTLVLGGVSFYVILPAIHPQNPGFWIYLAFLLATFLIPFGLLSGSLVLKKQVVGKGKTASVKSNVPGWMVLTVLAPIAVLLIGQLVSSTFFNAKAYAGVIDVKEAVFQDDMPETNNVTNIALMDSETASVIGNRTLGSLANVVSQYGVGETYSQINYQGKPKKVANLEYLGFFKWWNNSESGIPGYVMVDPVQNTAEYVEFRTPMKYVESGYFGDDLMRQLRFSYPTKIFGSCYFEIDEEGNPYYIVSCLKPKVMMFGAMDVDEVIIFNPCDGSSELYSLETAPAWIDTVFTGSLACEKYDWYGLLSGGFWNSVIGNRGCKQTTSDFGYLILGDDVWYFTGVTSITSDASNIGFIISNARTGEYKFYPVVGAEEYSAMGAAEGEVQEKQYKASFPSLINVSGQATYIMVLKDANSIVKLYALVNVENYRLVATGRTQAETMTAYRNLLKQNGVDLLPGEGNGEEKETVRVKVADVRIVSIENEPVVYLTAEDGSVYKGTLASDESLILIRVGDELDIVPEETATARIYSISEWSFHTEEEPTG